MSDGVISLLGRDRDLGAARQLLARHRCVAILGSIGVGTSAFASAVGDDRSVHLGGGLRLLRNDPLRALERAVKRDLGGTADPAAAVRDVVADGVLVIDGFSWVDDVSLDVLEQLLGSVDLVLVGHHEVEQDRLRRFIGSIEPFVLRPLGPEDTAALARHLAPHAAPDQRDAAVVRSGGRPRVLAELLEAGELSVPTRSALEQWVGGLADDVAAGVLALALASGGAPATIVDDACRAALERHDLADSMDTAAGPRLQLTFPLAGELVMAQANHEQHRHAHLRLGTSPDVAPVVAARHLIDGGDLQAAAVTARALLDDAATSILDRCSAANILVEALGDAGTDPDRLLAATANIEAGQPDTALALTDQITSPPLRARAQLVAGRALRQLGQPLAARLALDAADRPNDAAVERAKVALWADWDPARASQELEATDPDVEVGLRPVVHTLRSTDHGWPQLAEVLNDTSTTTTLDDELEQQIFLVGVRLLRADLANTIRAVDALQHRADDLLIDRWRLAAAGVAAMVRLHLGDDPSQAVEQLEALSRQVSIGDLQPLIGAHLAVGFADFGRNADALAVFDRTGDDGSIGTTALRSWAGAEVQFSAGRPGGVRAALELAERLEPGLPTQPLVRVIRSWSAFEFDKLAPPPGPTTCTVPAFSAVLDECHGIRLLAAHDPAEAAPHFRHAAQGWDATHHRGALRCRWAEGEALRRAGQLDDARSVLQAVETDAQQAGMLPMVAKIRQSLRRAGITRRSQSTPTKGALTGRERDVLELVGEGLPATTIAQQLGVAPSTVETQISSAMRRLGARTRLQAVALMRAQTRSSR
jgi:DNA-binding CsgD family transcriptional regulator